MFMYMYRIYDFMALCSLEIKANRVVYLHLTGFNAYSALIVTSYALYKCQRRCGNFVGESERCSDRPKKQTAWHSFCEKLAKEFT